MDGSDCGLIFGASYNEKDWRKPHGNLSQINRPPSQEFKLGHRIVNSLSNLITFVKPLIIGHWSCDFSKDFYLQGYNSL
jgi:hypothetical protein